MTLSVAYPLATVGPDSVGGAEQVLKMLDGHLTRRGHRSLVVGCEGSSIAGTLIPIRVPPNPITEAARCFVQQQYQIAIIEALQRYAIDLVHMHGCDFYAYLPPDGIPVLATLHLPLEWYPPTIFDLLRPQTYFNCVSWAEHNSCPARDRELPPVENGVEIGSFAVKTTKRDYVVALGRICPEKGFHCALDAARRAGLPLFLCRICRCRAFALQWNHQCG